MTVKEIFDLRKQGKIEEAYDAIRPMYAAHKGKYTTLCMFWTAADVLKLRLQQGRTEEAEKIYEALKRMLPRIEEITKELDSKKAPEAPNPETNLPWENNKPQHSAHSAAAFLRSAEHRLASIVPAGSPAAQVPVGSPAVHSAVSPATTGSPAAPVPAGSPAVPPASTASPAAVVPAGSPAVSPASTASPAAVMPAASPAVHSAVSPAPIVPAGSPACPVLADSVGEIKPSGDHSPHSPHHGTDVPPLPWGQKKVFDCIKTYPGLSVPRISASTRIPAKSIERHIAALIDKKLIEHRGSKKTGGYYPLYSIISK